MHIRVRALLNHVDNSSRIVVFLLTRPSLSSSSSSSSNDTHQKTFSQRKRKSANQLIDCRHRRRKRLTDDTRTKVRPMVDNKKTNEECKACNIRTQIILEMKWRVEKEATRERERNRVVKMYLHIYNINSKTRHWLERKSDEREKNEERRIISWLCMHVYQYSYY